MTITDTRTLLELYDIFKKHKQELLDFRTKRNMLGQATYGTFTREVHSKAKKVVCIAYDQCDKAMNDITSIINKEDNV